MLVFVIFYFKQSLHCVVHMWIEVKYRWSVVSILFENVFTIFYNIEVNKDSCLTMIVNLSAVTNWNCNFNSFFKNEVIETMQCFGTWNMDYSKIVQAYVCRCVVKVILVFRMIVWTLNNKIFTPATSKNSKWQRKTTWRRKLIAPK